MNGLNLEDYTLEKAEAFKYRSNLKSNLFKTLTPEQKILWKMEIEEAYLAGIFSKTQSIKDLKEESDILIDEVFNCLPNCEKLSPKIIFETKEKIKNSVGKIFLEEFTSSDDINGVVDKFKQRKLDMLFAKALLSI